MKKTVNPYIKCIFKAAKDVIHHDGIEHAGYLAFLISKIMQLAELSEWAVN